MAMHFPEWSVRRCHKRKRTSPAGSEADAISDAQVRKEPGGYLCAICLDEIEFEKDWFVQYCPRGHKFHSLCAIPLFERTSRLPSCPVCRGPPRRLTRALLEMDCSRLLCRSMMDRVHGPMTIAIDVRSQSYRFACLRHQIARRDTYPVDCNLPAVHPAGWVVQRDLLRCHVGGSSANLTPLFMQPYL